MSAGVHVGDAASVVPRPAMADRDDPLAIPGGKWGLWRQACLRAPGFPAETVLAFATPESARLAGELIRSQDTTTRDRLRKVFDAERAQVRAAVRALARDARFQEAIIWQNRRALHDAVGRFAEAPPDRVDSGMRRKELLVASYAQRYAVKNDTIGFFGPVGWMRFSDGPIAAAVESGPQPIAARATFFESWGIDAVARALDDRRELRPWQVPRVAAHVRLDRATIMMAARAVATLSVEQARLFAACDGSRHARAIASELVASGCISFPEEAAVYALLDQWCRAGYMTWTFEGPRELRPELTLRRRLDAIDDAALRENALQAFDAVDRARVSIAAAAGHAAALDQAFDTLEVAFSRVTGAGATRSAGQMYAGRTLVYEDCRRGQTVELGRDVVDRLGPPLSLVLQSARWIAQELARSHAVEFRRIYDELSRGGRREVTLAAFFARTALTADARGVSSPILAAVSAGLQERWAQVLGLSSRAHRIAYRAHMLRPAVDAAFPVSGPPASAWARHICPDVMIDAPSLDAIRSGDYQLVLGELHIINTLVYSTFMTQCPDPAALMGALERDCPEPRILWLAPKEAATQRMQYIPKPDDFVYVRSLDASPAPPERTLRSADLIVVDSGGELVVQSRDGRVRVPCGEFFGIVIMGKGASLFSVLGSMPHRPRVTVDDVVICREHWMVSAADVTFANRGDDLERFVGCTRWMRDRELPRFVFVRIPTERKPVYLDSHSPVYVDLVSKAIRAAQRIDPAMPITLTEMLPAPSGAWLTDAEGRRYTSEFRIVTVDPSVGRRPRGEPR